MSTTKNIMGAIAAIVLLVSVAMGSLAFKAKSDLNNEKVSLNLTWYEYLGPDFSEAEIRESSNYNKVSGTPGCSSNINICAVQLENALGLHPVFDTDSPTADAIWDAQDTNVATPDIKMKD